MREFILRGRRCLNIVATRHLNSEDYNRHDNNEDENDNDDYDDAEYVMKHEAMLSNIGTGVYDDDDDGHHDGIGCADNGAYND